MLPSEEMLVTRAQQEAYETGKDVPLRIARSQTSVIVTPGGSLRRPSKTAKQARASTQPSPCSSTSGSPAKAKRKSRNERFVPPTQSQPAETRAKKKGKLAS